MNVIKRMSSDRHVSQRLLSSEPDGLRRDGCGAVLLALDGSEAAKIAAMLGRRHGKRISRVLYRRNPLRPARHADEDVGPERVARDRGKAQQASVSLCLARDRADATPRAPRRIGRDQKGTCSTGCSPRADTMYEN